MSVVIGICGVNFCELYADGRLMRYTEHGPEIAAEDYRKIKRLGKQTVVGVSGTIRAGENLWKPFSRFRNADAITPTMAKSAITQFLSANKDLPGSRTYLIGGKSVNGFVLYAVKYNDKTGEIEEHDYSPRLPDYAFGASIALPTGMQGELERYLTLLNDAIRTSRTDVQLREKIAQVIRDIAQQDESVNDRVTSVRIAQ